MKTRSRLTGIIALFIAFMTFSAGVSKAQCNYTIGNRLNCPVDVKIEIYTWNPVPPMCGLLCFSYPATVPGGGAVIPINCGGCKVCDIRVYVVAIAGTPTSGFADFSTNIFPGNAVTPVPAGCSPSGSAAIFYDPSPQMFIIHP